MKHLYSKTAFIASLFLPFYFGVKAQITTTNTAVTTTTDQPLSSGPAQNIFVELGGPGIIFSANFDTRFNNRRDGLGGRAGIGFIASDGVSITSLPLQLNYLLGNKGKYFEIGGGATFVSINGKSSDFFFSGNTSATIGTLTFGYRYQPIDGGFNFRASFNPIFDSQNFSPFFGLSFGYTFK